jgi:hypothetical protein
VTDQLPVHATNELVTTGTEWRGAGGAQAPSRGNVTMKVHRTGCACGWHSEWRATKALARHDAQIHLLECPGDAV